MEYPSAPPEVASAAPYRRLAKAMTATAGALLAITLAGCGGSPSSAPAAGSPPSTGTTGTAAPPGGSPIPGLLAFNGTFQLHGAITKQSAFSGNFAASSGTSSCAALAAKGTFTPPGEKPQFALPTPHVGSSVYFLASILPYHGPGTYGRAALLGGGGASIISGPTAEYNPLASTATVSVTIEADGSGTYTFANAAAVNPAKPSVSGSLSWTCSG
jgi:hypothetical protein